MFTTPEFIAADVAYRRERISATYEPAAHHRPLRQRLRHVSFARPTGHASSC